MPNELVDTAQVVVVVVVVVEVVAAAVTKSKVSSVSMRSSYLVCLPLTWSSLGLLEFCITDMRGETSSTLNELQEGGGKVEQGPLGDLKLPKVGQYELLDFVDLARLS